MTDTRQITVTSFIAIAVCAGLVGGLSFSVGLNHLRGHSATPCVCPPAPAPAPAVVCPAPVSYPPLAAPPAPLATVPAAYNNDDCRHKGRLIARQRGGVVHISRGDFDRLLGSNDLATGARLVPSIHDGQPDGFKIYAIRPCSIFQQLGLHNADRIFSVNGMDLRTPDHALEAYTRLQKASSFTIQIVRQGQPMTLRIKVTP